VKVTEPSIIIVIWCPWQCNFPRPSQREGPAGSTLACRALHEGFWIYDMVLYGCRHIWSLLDAELWWESSRDVVSGSHWNAPTITEPLLNQVCPWPQYTSSSAPGHKRLPPSDSWQGVDCALALRKPNDTFSDKDASTPYLAWSWQRVITHPFTGAHLVCTSHNSWFTGL
jgi:hypothetical protein